MDRTAKPQLLAAGLMAALLALAAPAQAQNPSGASYTQCPGDTNGNSIKDGAEVWAPNQKVHALVGR